jgi:hypothetical protein
MTGDEVYLRLKPKKIHSHGSQMQLLTCCYLLIRILICKVKEQMGINKYTNVELQFKIPSMHMMY